MKFTAMAVSTLALSAFLSAAPAMAQGRVDANGMPTDHSTPAEQAATAALNNQVSGSNAAADAQAQQNDAQYQQQQAYQGQLQQNQAAQADYQDKAAQYAQQAVRYENLRARYAAERAAYHRGVWPDRWARWTLDENAANLVGQRCRSSAATASARWKTSPRRQMAVSPRCWCAWTARKWCGSTRPMFAMTAATGL